ncbi:MAG TPA: hypothetical protein VJY39_06015 [Acidisphaera sp.]|nr:hypothetical protein [Acidisphaera sp.]
MRAGTVSDVGGAAVPELRYPHAMSVSVKLPVHMTAEEFLDWNPGDGQTAYRAPWREHAQPTVCCKASSPGKSAVICESTDPSATLSRIQGSFRS